MLNVLQKLRKNEEQGQAKAEAVYRDLVQLAAVNDDLSAKQLADLSDAMRVLGLEQSDVEADVSAVHRMADLNAELQDADRADAKLKERIDEIGEYIHV